MKLKLTDLPVVYINLDEQTDRKQTLEENLKGLGFKILLEYLDLKILILIGDVHILMHLL